MDATRSGTEANAPEPGTIIEFTNWFIVSRMLDEILPWEGIHFISTETFTYLINDCRFHILCRKSDDSRTKLTQIEQGCLRLTIDSKPGCSFVIVPTREE